MPETLPHDFHMSVSSSPPCSCRGQRHRQPGQGKGRSGGVPAPMAHSQLAGLALLPRAFIPQMLTTLAGRQAPRSQR